MFYKLAYAGETTVRAEMARIMGISCNPLFAWDKRRIEDVVLARIHRVLHHRVEKIEEDERVELSDSFAMKLEEDESRLDELVELAHRFSTNVRISRVS